MGHSEGKASGLTRALFTIGESLDATGQHTKQTEPGYLMLFNFQQSIEMFYHPMPRAPS